MFLINDSWICLGFTLDLSDIDLLNIDLPDADYDLLDAGSRKHFVGPQNVLKTFSVQQFSVLKTSWKTKNYYAKDVFKMSSRHVLNTSSRRLKDQQMFSEKTLTFFFSS